MKRNLGEIVNRAAYGKERIILLSRGKPRTALISIEDLKQLEMLAPRTQTPRNIQAQMDLLAEMDALRKQIRQDFGELTDSAEALREVRGELRAVKNE